MRFIGAALAALLLIACPPAASAADKGGPNPLLPPLFNDADLTAERPHRTGLYAGILAGYDAAELETAWEGEGLSFADQQPFVGGFVGFNARVADGLVLGIEGDYVFTDFSASRDVQGVNVRFGTDYLASIRGRAGVPMGIALLYVTGGVAFTEAKGSVGELGLSDKATLIGGVMGAGIEIEMSKTVFARLEGLHYWFPDEGMSDGDVGIEAELEQTAVRLGLGVKF